MKLAPGSLAKMRASCKSSYVAPGMLVLGVALGPVSRESRTLPCNVAGDRGGMAQLTQGVDVDRQRRSGCWHGGDGAALPSTAASVISRTQPTARTRPSNAGNNWPEPVRSRVTAIAGCPAHETSTPFDRLTITAHLLQSKEARLSQLRGQNHCAKPDADPRQLRDCVEERLYIGCGLTNDQRQFIIIIVAHTEPGPQSDITRETLPVALDRS